MIRCSWLRAGWAVARAEIERLRLAPVAAILLGLMPPVAPLLPTVAHHDAANVSQSALLLVFGLTVLLWPVGLGASIASHDLVEKRLGFYFVRPISGALLWTAKLGAAAFLYLASCLLVVLPSFALDPSLLQAATEGLGAETAAPWLATPENMVYSILQPGRSPWPWQVRAALCLALAFLYLMGVHTVSTLVRLRTPRQLVDLAAAGTLLTTAWWIRDLCLSHQAYGPLLVIERGGVFLVTLVFFAAGARQMADGRSDPTRSRRSLAGVLWPGLGFVALACLTYAIWATRPGLADLESAGVAYASPAGPHLVLGGTVTGRAGHRASFLVDFEGGESEYLGSLPVTAYSLRFSADGGRLVWPRCRRLAPVDCEIWTRDLRAGTSSRATGIPSGLWSEESLELSPSGDLLLAADWTRTSVYAVGSGALVAALRLDKVMDARFLSPREVLIARLHEGGTELSIWNLEQRRRHPLVTLPGAWRRGQRLDPRGEMLFYLSLIPRVERLIELATGELVFDVTERFGHFGRLLGARFLEDGRLLLMFGGEPAPETAIPVAEPFDATLILLDPRDPESWRKVSVPGASALRLGAEISPGRILVGRRRPAETGVGDVAAVDFLRGLGLEAIPGADTLVLEAGADPAAPSSLTLVPLAGGILPPRLHDRLPQPGSPSAFYFVAKDHAMLRWDPDAGGPELLVPPLRNQTLNE